MSKKEKFKSFISDAGQAAKSAIDKTKETATALMDQDNDGKVDIADLSIIKDSVSSAVKDGSEAALKFANDTIHHIERRRDDGGCAALFPANADDVQRIFQQSGLSQYRFG